METEMLRVGQKAWIVWPGIDKPWSAWDQKYNFEGRAKSFMLVEVFVCDRSQAIIKSETTNREFLKYKLSFTDREFATSVRPGQEWDTPFEWSGPIALKRNEVLDISMQELGPLADGYRLMIETLKELLSA